ncbi:MAG TPA: hypothetical protein VGX23_33695 [Actinocrinis sp.]|nr:hypothetical protein [Actinocrinis sp.]
MSIGSVFAFFVVVGAIGDATGAGKKAPAAPAAAAQTSPPAQVVKQASSAPAKATTKAAAPVIVLRTSAAPAAPVDNLTGFGATVATWDAHHTADPTFNAGSAFDADPNLPQINGNEGARYAAVNYEGGLVLDYQVDEPTGMTVTAAFSDVISRELPPGTTVLWKLDQSANGCNQEEVESETLGTVLSAESAGDPQGAVLLEAQSANLNAFDPSNIAYVLLSTAGSLTAAQAPGC